MAKSGVKVTPQSKRNVARMIARLSGLTDKLKIQAALFEAGNLVRNEAIRNITKQGIVDSGVLRASMSFRLESGSDILNRLVVGPFGVKYARINEFGGAFTDRQRRAMFAKFRETGRKPRPGKGIIRGRTWRARPYLRPALRSMRKAIVQLLREIPAKEV